jgi:DNA helicase-2/ATP-dependent DNA helicase PcrA
LALPDLESFDDLLDCIRTIVTQPAIPEKADYVRVMSLHKSKGLTSKVAIVSGCTQGLIPFVNLDAPPVEAAAITQEQRRLFYVAITRCTQTLVISSFATIPRQLAWKLRALVDRGSSVNAPTIASQFINELGPSAPASKRGSVWAQREYA